MPPHPAPLLPQKSEGAAAQILDQRGWKTDYIAIKRRADLKAPRQVDLESSDQLVVLGASKLGATRLIDNIEVSAG